jgi:hypothetical protein
MNQHLKLAYDHGVQQALIDSGITKTSNLSEYTGTSNYGDMSLAGQPDVPMSGESGAYHSVPVRESGILDTIPLFGKRPYVLPGNAEALREALSGIKGLDLAPSDYVDDPNELAVNFGHKGSLSPELEEALQQALLAGRA